MAMMEEQHDLILMAVILAALALIIWVEHPNLGQYLCAGGETRSMRVEGTTCRTVEEGCRTSMVAPGVDKDDGEGGSDAFR